MNYATGVTRTCTTEDADATFTIDVSNGRVERGDGDCCDVFEFQFSVDSPQVMFLSGDQIGRDYEFIGDESTEAIESDYTSLLGVLATVNTSFEEYYNPHPSDPAYDSTYSPSIELATYSAEVGLDYESDSAGYESTVTVTPNEL